MSHSSKIRTVPVELARLRVERALLTFVLWVGSVISSFTILGARLGLGALDRFGIILMCCLGIGFDVSLLLGNGVFVMLVAGVELSRYRLCYLAVNAGSISSHH